MKIFTAVLEEKKVTGQVGEILKVDKTGLYVQAKDGVVNVQMLQFPMFYLYPLRASFSLMVPVIHQQPLHMPDRRLPS